MNASLIGYDGGFALLKLPIDIYVWVEAIKANNRQLTDGLVMKAYIYLCEFSLIQKKLIYYT